MGSSLKEYKGRYTVLAWLIALYFLPLTMIMSLFGSPKEWYWWDIGYYFSSGTFLILILMLIAFHTRLNIKKFFGPIPDAKLLIDTALLLAALWVVSSTINYLTFYPLSWVMPDFVSWWFIDLPGSIYHDGSQIILLPSILSFISLVVIAPVTEEVLFRGYLLHRWSHKWGIIKAVLVSSIIFGIAHPDIISATVFGIAMCLLYMRSGSLIAPIILHAAWNTVCWLWEYNSLMANGFDYRYTLEDFHGSWPYGVICLVFSVICFYAYKSRFNENKNWRLPNI